MFDKKKKGIGVVLLFSCLALAGCGLGEGESRDGLQRLDAALLEEEKEESQAKDLGQQENEAGSQAGDKIQEEKENNLEYPRGDRIEAQSFEVELRPLGKVTFASYEPERSDNPLADVVFLIEKEGEVLMQLPGTGEGNIGKEMFDQVEAVSFLDFNKDGCDDIIMILSYFSGAGPQEAAPHSVIRYYTGTEEGSFVYEAQTSEAATLAVAEITIESAKGFIGVKTPDTPPEWIGTRDVSQAEGLEAWQQAYLDYLEKDSQVEYQSGYTLIAMSSDGILQLVEVGSTSASGCRIISYGKGQVHVTQLNRHNFSYIPGENLLCNSDGLMDTYSDIVYRLEDGEMTIIGEGHYGAKDNSKVEFDEEGNPVYQYEWNGTVMTQEAYAEAFSQVYDASRAKTYDYESLYSADEVKRAIENY